MCPNINAVNEPLVSVVMPVYNSARFVAETINSLTAQTYTHLEIICIDDCSADNSLEVLNEMAAKDDRIKVVASSPNQGPSAVRNMGINLAAGKYIAFADSDDLAVANKIAMQVDYMESNPAIGLLGSYADGFGDVTWMGKKPCEHEEIFLQLMLFRCPFYMSAAMVRRQLLIDNNIRFIEEFKIGEDILFYATLANIAKTANLPVILSRIRIHQNSLSHSVKSDFRLSTPFLSHIFGIMQAAFGLSVEEAARVGFFYRQEPVNSDNIKNFDLLVQKFLANTLPAYRKFAKKSLFKRFYGLYKSNPQLTKSDRKVFMKNALKYKIAIFPAVKMLFKNKL